MSCNIQKKKKRKFLVYSPIFSIFTFVCLHPFARWIKNLKHRIQNCAEALKKCLRKYLSIVKTFKNHLFTCEKLYLIFICFLLNLITFYEYFLILESIVNVYLRYQRYIFRNRWESSTQNFSLNQYYLQTYSA